MERKPNFFIVGAPKCGTTAMSEYLRTHPNVFMSEPKEPNFFSDAGVWHLTRDDYLNLFTSASPQQTVLAEASTTYIFSNMAIPKIKEFNPNAKLMVMLRRPVDLVYSYHGQMLLMGFEGEVEFEKAWALQEKRAAHRCLPPGSSEFYKLLQYQWVGSIGRQVANLFAIFPKTQVHVALLDDLTANPRDEYLRLLSFLDLPDDGRVDFPRVNEATSNKVLWLGQTVRRVRRLISRPHSILRRKTGYRGTGLLRALNYVNTEKRTRSSLNPEFRRYLKEVFSDEVKLLEELLGRDLRSWREDDLKDLEPGPTNGS